LVSPPVVSVAGRFAPLLTVALIGALLHELRSAKRSNGAALA
jgi:hypothetical protein